MPLERFQDPVTPFSYTKLSDLNARVATAHEFYLDRLEREKQIEERKAKLSLLKVISLPPREFKEGSVLKVKWRKNEHVYVGTGGATALQESQDILPSGKRRKFDEHGDYLEPLDLAIEHNLCDSKEVPVSRIESEAPSEPAPIPPRRGQRIGFGSIAALPPRSIPTNTTPTPIPAAHAPPCDSCVENEVSPQEDLPHIRTKSGKSGEAGGVVITESGEYDELSSSDGEDCLSPEELTEQALVSERERQKRIFNFIHESVAAAPPQTTIIDQSLVDIQDIEPVPIVDQLKKSPFRSAVWSQSNLRFDPTVHRKSQKFHLTQEELEERDKTLKKRSDIGEDLAEQEASGTADLGKLKDIFHREGGLTWDSSGKGATQRDPKVNENLDNLILEAERYGFDVRGEEKAEGANEQKASSSMLFGFFDGDGGDAQNSEREDEMDDEDAEASAAEGGESSSDDSNIFSDDADSGDEDNGKRERSGYQQLDDEHKFHYPSFEEVLMTANKFKRDLYVSLHFSSSLTHPPPSLLLSLPRPLSCSVKV
jgi:hypothetical protein